MVAQHLWDKFWHWLASKKQTGVQVAEASILEQFIQIAPAGEAPLAIDPVRGCDSHGKLHVR